MPTRTDVPAEADILCEHCGYGLNGLPTDGRCPECGEPIADSTTDDGRVPPAWEDGGSTLARFLRTTKQVILAPANFFRHLQTRTDSDASPWFINQQHWISSLFFGLTAAVHTDSMGFTDDLPGGHLAIFYVAAIAILLARLTLHFITRLASALTHWEGTYWGYRLPPAVVRRVMNFHSAQLLPVAVVALLTVVTYRMMLATRVIDGRYGVPYLVVISIEVLLAAGYLFRTYWIAMKNIMYANR
jgi:hypothetical protein